MLQQIAFMPQHQFHVLINFSGEDERILAILPNEAGNFRVVYQGKTIAELKLNEGCCTCYKGKLKKNVMNQLEHQIKNHYA
ncbi:hypothetical protein [Mucilaginibacter endophyticus]|uniref:hypothetical protein n=1 Tax=Mucilaginibacter endophyticus TaxID=2675003 RepID=UPI000E0D7813|nr:hypothetical protein [Mucilaginibacter endophyticus]